MFWYIRVRNLIVVIHIWICIGSNIVAHHQYKDLINRDPNNINDHLKQVQSQQGWEVHFYTDDVSDAGTDAMVYIALKGNSGEWTESISFKGNMQNSFERDQTDIFTTSANDVGELVQLKVGHDNSGDNPSWFLDKVVLMDGSTTYTFECDKWLALDKGDNKIERILDVSEE